MPRRAIPLLVLALALATGLAWLLGRPQAAPGLDAWAPQEAGDPSTAPGRALPSAELLEGARLADGARGRHNGPNRSGRLRGRCVEHLNSAPLSGVGLRFAREGRTLAQVVSDARGEFSIESGALELGAAGFDEVEPRPPAGWWCVKQGLEEGPEGALYVARFAPRDLGPLDATLVDRATSEPVPEYLVRIVDSEGWSETLLSDARGRVRSEALFARGRLEIHGCPEEFGGQWRAERLASHEHVPAGGAPPLAVIPIPIGPTYRLRLENPGRVPLGKLRAFLTSGAWVEQAFEARDEASLVHPGEAPWVRFQEAAPWLEDPQLVVTDTGGRWFGHAPVKADAGIHPEPVPLALERMFRLRGRVLDAQGEPVARAAVELAPLDAGADVSPRSATSNGRGLFLVESVRPGRWEVLARHPREGMGRREFVLEGESSAALEVRLEPYLVAGDVSGVVRSLSGEFRGPLTVYLVPSGELPQDAPRRTIRIAWKKQGEAYEGRFRFEGVAHGDYELIASLRGVAFDVLPGAQAVHPPAEGLELVVRDDRERRRLSFIVLDDETGAWLHEAQVRLLDGDGLLAYEGAAAGWSASRMFADDEPIEWRVTHPGYHATFGDRTKFEELCRGQRGFALVRLKKD